MEIINPIMSEYDCDIKLAVYCYAQNIDPICHNNNIRHITNGKVRYCGNRKTCKCASESIEKKMADAKLKKYGDPKYNNPDKARETKKATGNYGIKKRKKTCLEKYGKDSFSKTSIYKEKTKETMLIRYGVIHYTNPDKTKKTCQTKYGVINPNQRHISSDTYNILHNKSNFIDFCSDKSRIEASLLLGIDNTTISNYASKYNCDDTFAVYNKSQWEDKIKDHLIDSGVKFVQNSRSIISPLELDFYLPDHNIAIEVNGNYWHSELAGNKDKNYHFNKWKVCREKGINLYSYFEDELIDNIDLIKAKIDYVVCKKHKVIGARKTIIKAVTYNEEKSFLQTYHIQGPSKARNKTIGAYYNEELVAVFSWLKQKQYLEITRFACDTTASYPGLFSKMMKHMIRECQFTGQIVSFSNNGHSNGGVYNASGFTIDKIIGGAYFYMKNHSARENRQRYMKSKIVSQFNDSRFREDNKSEWTEWQAMQALGYDRIWDSGKIKWIKTVDKPATL